MNIALDEFESWDSLREIHYRRNVIIHNKGIANKLYCEKTGCKRCGEHLSTDSRYVSNAIRIVVSFMDFLHSRTRRKFKLREPAVGK